MSGLAKSIGGMSVGRPEHDYYPTPPDATEALLRVESFTGPVWEPACGDGAICRVLDAHGIQNHGTDLIDRGWGTAPHDFLTSPYLCDNIITNPPFKLAEEFIDNSLARTTGKTAMLLRLAFLEGGRRKPKFAAWPLARVHVFSKRLTMHREGKGAGGGGMICFAWFVFEHGHEGAPTIGWL